MPDRVVPRTDQHVRDVLRLDAVAVARWWARSVEAGDVDAAMGAYAPDAELRVDGSPPRRGLDMARALASLPVCGARHRADSVSFDDGDGEVWIRWSPGVRRTAVEVRCVIDHGVITAQDVTVGGPATPLPPADDEEFHIEVVRHGRIPPGSVEAGVEKLRRAAHHSGVEVRSARLKLRQLRDPAATNGALAEGSLDLDGQVVRAHVAAGRMADAIDRMGHRLDDQLRHRSSRLAHARSTAVEPRPGEWRHGNLPTSRPLGGAVPVDERQVVRHKTWGGAAQTVDEAAFDLEMVDHRFLLFTELHTGRDALLRVTDEGWSLSQVDGGADAAVDGAATAVELDAAAPPVLTLPDAVERVAAGGEDHLFFENATTGRGNVLYVRHDGNFGLIAPDDEP